MISRIMFYTPRACLGVTRGMLEGPLTFLKCIWNVLEIFQNFDKIMVSRAPNHDSHVNSCDPGGECFAPPLPHRGSAPSIHINLSLHHVACLYIASAWRTTRRDQIFLMTRNSQTWMITKSTQDHAVDVWGSLRTLKNGLRHPGMIPVGFHEKLRIRCVLRPSPPT